MVLTQRITFTVTSELSDHEEKKHKTRDVAMWIGEEVKKGLKVSFDQLKTIQIPAVPESELKNCSAIHIEYTLKVRIRFVPNCKQQRGESKSLYGKLRFLDLESSLQFLIPGVSVVQ